MINSSFHKFGELYFPERSLDFPEIMRRPVTIRETYKFIKNFDIVIDIGAHVGTYTLELAKQFKTVYAFEPVKSNYECLLLNVGGLTNIKTYNIALGNNTEMVRMVGSPSTGKNVEFLTPQRTGAVYDVPLKCLDDVLNVKPDIMKIDVEGMEWHVLRGAERTIHEYKPVIYIENKPSRWKMYGEVDPQILLEQWGFKMVKQMEKDQIYVFK